MVLKAFRTTGALLAAAWVFTGSFIPAAAQETLPDSLKITAYPFPAGSRPAYVELPTVLVSETLFRTGATTVLSTRDLQLLPSVNRSLNDFTRLMPQANGFSFAGRDGRYNYLTIDGAAFSNSFGLNGQTKNFPGGDAQPISLEAIDRLSVAVAPFDIRHANFTGARIQAVTKRGTTTWQGAAYTFQQPGSFAGKKVGDTGYEWDESPRQTYGFSLGGPIVKHVLHFFVNGEYETTSYPSTSWKASETGTADSEHYISRAQTSQLDALQTYLQNTYHYDAGGYQWGTFHSTNYKLLGRIDGYFLDRYHHTHHLTVRYNHVTSQNDELPIATSAPNGIPRSGYGRTGETAMAFTNAGYGFENTVHSAVGELYSEDSNRKFTNRLLLTYTAVRDRRTAPGSVFPFVDIWEKDSPDAPATPYTSFGYELYSYNNDVQQRTFTLSDDFTARYGRHTLTAGLSYEQQYFGNAYMIAPTGYYRYNSIKSFMDNEAPAAYAITYGANGVESPYTELSFGMGAVYLQDEWQGDRLSLTFGLRLERPFYLSSLQANPNIAAGQFAGGTSPLTQGAEPYTMQVGTWPDEPLAISPRASFDWKISDRYRLRGGTGIFTGYLPFVWFTNQPTNSGTLQFTKTLSGAAVPADMRFDPDIYAQINKYPAVFAATTGVQTPVEVAKDFRLPQVWRTHLVGEVALHRDLRFTLEGVFTKDIYAVLQQNINEKAPTLRFAGSDNRPYYATYKDVNSRDIADNRLDPALSNAMVLTNTHHGYQYALTAQLAGNFARPLSGSLAYTFSGARDQTINPGDQAASAWQSNAATGSLNSPGLSYSDFSVPHRIVGILTCSFDWLHRFRTALSLCYQGAAQGRLNYVYTNDLNGDGNYGDLLYIPKDAGDIIFQNSENGTAQQQSDAFFRFVAQDPYLSNHRGEYARRFGGLYPWRHQFDLKLVQDIYYSRRHSRKIQLTLDIMNLGNLLNSHWGTLQTQITGAYRNMPLLTFAGTDAAGRPTFTLPTAHDRYYTESFKDLADYAGTWAMQVGMRIAF